MNSVNEYFKKHTDKLSFIELRDNKTLNVEGYKIKEDTPLPILTEALVEEIKEGKLEEEIKMTNIIDGIVFLMGIDTEFKYIKEYQEILNYYNEDIEEYIFYKGIRNIEKEDYDKAAICFRALKIINPKNINGIFNYALTLESIAKTFFAAEEDETGLDFLNLSTGELESILDIDKTYPLAYYKLGFHYKFYGQFLKAKLIWQKYILLDKDDLRLQEIRIEIENIENDVILEGGITYLAKGDFEKALNEFLKLLPKLEKWWELNYYIGLSYKALSDYEQAIKYFKISLEENKQVAEVYNELGISYLLLGEIQEAIEIFNKGIAEIDDDYKLLFNRGMSYLQIDDVKNAYEDIRRAVEINPEDENMKLQKERLEEIL